MRHPSLLPTVLGSLMVATLLLTSACDSAGDAEPACLPPGSYDVYLSSSSNDYLYRLNTETRTSDSFFVGGSQTRLAFDPIRKLLYGSGPYEFEAPYTIWRALFTMDTERGRLLESRLNYLFVPNVPDAFLTSDGGTLLLSYASNDTTWTVFANTRTGEVLHTEGYGRGDEKSMLRAIHPRQSIAFYSPNVAREVVAYDFDAYKVMRRYPLRADGKRFIPRRMVIHPDGQRLYLTATADTDQGQGPIDPGDYAGEWLLELDLDTGALKIWTQIHHAMNRIVLAPDGSSLFQTQPGNWHEGPSSPIINVYDTDSGRLNHTISLVGARWERWEREGDGSTYVPNPDQ